MRYISGKGKSLLQQKLEIEKKFPIFICSVHKNKLICKGEIKSTLFAKDYIILIEKKEKKSPKVFILKPEIVKKHVYPDNSLCFYSYKNFKWSDNFYISDYHIPWTAAWIYFYEAWLITGIWFADEVEHGNKPKIYEK
jgi:hypothetical protein